MKSNRQRFAIACGAGITAAVTTIVIATSGHAATTPGATASAGSTSPAPTASSPGTSPATSSTGSPTTSPGGTGTPTGDSTATVPPPSGGSTGITTRPGPCGPGMHGSDSMTVTYTASAGSSSAGTYDVWVRSRQAAAGSWRKELGHIEPGQSRTVRLSWPAQYADVAVYVGYRSEVDTSETVAYDAHPHFTTCASAAPSTTGPSGPQTAEPPTPSPVTTALGVTG